MKAKVKFTKEVEIKKILINISPRHIGDSDDDDMPTDFPLVNENKDSWVAMVDIDTGKIEGWPEGEEREMSVKVCDAGTYSLYDADGNEVAEIVNDYVPNGVVPGEYGDYVDMKINGDGIVTNWPKNPDVSEFFKGDE